MAQRGSMAQFSYDFGIAIAQNTVNRVTRLAGASLTLASAFYALKNTATEYVNTLRENTLRFGGVLSTMKAMEQAQDRLIKGQSYFSVDDQLRGMNELASVGIKVGKNLNWINKAAHATGKSYAQFAGMISSAIQGNSQALVDAGLMTQGATRMFDKYAAGTIMRQQAILNFVKNHKGLMNAIKNDFVTIQDQMRRLQAVWQGFLQSIIGKPNDPSSLYGQIAKAMGGVADSLAANMKTIRRYGYIIGHVLGWVAHQVGSFVKWIGHITKKAIQSVWKVTDNYQEQARSIVVWLEFWKQTIVDYFQKYKGEIKMLLKLLLLYEGLKYTFVIGDAAIKSIRRFRKEMQRLAILQQAYIDFMGPSFSMATRKWQALAVWMPRPFRRAWVAGGKFFGGMNARLRIFVARNRVLLSRFGKVLLGPLYAMIHPIKTLKVLWRGMLKGIIAFLTPLAKLRAFCVRFFPLLPSLIKGFIRSGGAAFIGFLKTSGNMIVNLAMSTPGLLRSAFNSVALAVSNPIQSLATLGAAIRNMFIMMKGAMAYFYASNPVGWITAAVVATILLYEKFSSVRVVVNNLAKMLWEWWKLLWNVIYGGIIAIAVFFKNKIILPIVNFFKNLWVMIKKVWAAFKDSSIGRWINETIVQPIKKFINMVLRFIGQFFKGAANFIGLFNKGLAEKIRAGEKDLGLSFSLAADGKTDYDTKDDTDYLKKGLNWVMDGMKGGKGSKVPNMANANPLTTGDVEGMGGQSGSNNTNMTFSNGAIQVIVQKGENIDEYKLARKIKEVLKETARDDNMRGGTI